MLLAGCDSTHTAKGTQARNDFASLTNALQMYRLNAGRYPTTEQGLDALVNRPAIDPQPRMWTQIADRVPLDPWARPYHYRWEPGSKPDTETFVLWSFGKDGKDGTADDIQSDPLKPEPLPTD
jgi:general secretion pathway protein G